MSRPPPRLKRVSSPTSTTPCSPQIQMQPIEWFWFTGSEKKQVAGLHPQAARTSIPSRKYPVKFLIHGGPQGAWGDDWSFRWNPNLFAASGYVVVMINPRGSTGYGQQFIDDDQRRLGWPSL